MLPKYRLGGLSHSKREKEERSLRQVQNQARQIPFDIFFNLNLFILITLGLCCCLRAFSSCGERGLLCTSGALAWATLYFRCPGFSLPWLLSLWSVGSRVHRLQWLQHRGSVVSAQGLQSIGSLDVAHGLRCPAACGIFPDQGLNL